ncbi:CE1759 family FMN reductase, partial [Streptomyces calidiresistens]
MQRTVLAVSAGTGRPSATRLLADRLLTAVREAARSRADTDAAAPRTEVIELREHAVDIASAGVTGFPGAGLRALLDRVRAADGLVVATPVHSASYSGLFKSFFDVLGADEPTALRGVPVLQAATGGTARHSLVLDHAMRPLFSHLGATVLPTGVYAAPEDWGGGSTGRDALGARITRAGAELAAAVLGPVDEGPRPAPGAEGDAEGIVPFERYLDCLLYRS